MVVGLLFLAFAFFAVGQASATRNGAQGAADSAALAAAQRVREELGPKVLAALTTPGGLDNIFNGIVIADAHNEAATFASKNHADLTGFDSRAGGVGQFKFTADVKTQYTVGTSVIPGTEDEHGTASATAVIELRCTLPPGGGGNSPTPTPTSVPTPTPTPPPVTITCDGKDMPVDPLPDLEKIFSVKLVD